MSSDNAFQVSSLLTTGDWDMQERAWKCEMLSIPGASLASISNIDGIKIQSNLYHRRKDTDMIDWKSDDIEPNQIIANIILDRNWFASKADSDRYKFLSILLPFVGTITGAIVAAIVALFINSDKESSVELNTAAIRTYEADAINQRISYLISVSNLDRSKYIRQKEFDDYSIVVGIRGRSAISPIDGTYNHAQLYQFANSATQIPQMTDDLKGVLATKCVDFVLFRVKSSSFARKPFKFIEGKFIGSGCPD
jgi:hypothetical protein